MPLLTCEFVDGDVREWHATADGVERRRRRDYRPRLYASGDRDARRFLAEADRKSVV